VGLPRDIPCDTSQGLGQGEEGGREAHASRV